ncbi:MAG: tungstate ABC transporter substrate-binding protein WtpA [Thermodesulfobacteria bacterium]|nr:tungstate ABC transporter substrate-binding protein WtpA [Thermodesulfobacteriota bacterium]
MRWTKICFTLLLCTLTLVSSVKAKTIVTVFHAGSLSVPFAKMQKVFEKLHPNIELRRESSGSVQAVRKVIDLHKPCDVIAVADYTLIPKMMFPKYASYVKLFARNELVLCFTKRSRYAKIVNSKNWYEILQKPGVKWGFSNPNDDPCGYRTVLAIGLASLYYNNPQLVKNLIGSYTNIAWNLNKQGIIFKVPKEVRFNPSKLAIRPKSVALLGLLESGAIDYAFEYKSVALQHKLLFVELPRAFNLSSLKYSKFYKKAKVILGNGKTIFAKPIVYGITVVKSAPHPKAAKLWEKFVTSKRGAQILKDCHQTPIYPAKVIYAK